VSTIEATLARSSGTGTMGRMSELRGTNVVLDMERDWVDDEMGPVLVRMWIYVEVGSHAMTEAGSLECIGAAIGNGAS